MSVLAFIVKELSAFSLYKPLYSGICNLAIKIHSMLKLEINFWSESDFLMYSEKKKIKSLVQF